MSIVKLLHLLSLFCWIGPLLTSSLLRRLIENENREMQEKLRELLKKIYLLIDLPAMVLAIATGLILAFVKGVDFKAGWFHLKMTSAFFLIFFDLAFAHALFRGKRSFKRGFGWVALFLIGILFSLYVLKPPANDRFFVAKKE